MSFILNQEYSDGNTPIRPEEAEQLIPRISTLGVRGIKSTDQEYRDSLAHGNLIVPADHVRDQGVAGVLQALPASLGNYYVSIDIDGLDPSIAPGTESPEAEGLTFTQAERLLREIAGRGQMVGLDLVEVNPYLDHAELTQYIAVQLIIEALANRFGSAENSSEDRSVAEEVQRGAATQQLGELAAARVCAAHCGSPVAYGSLRAAMRRAEKGTSHVFRRSWCRMIPCAELGGWSGRASSQEA